MQKKLSEWQTKYREHMSERWSELERGVFAMESHRKHIPVWQYKKAQQLDKQAEKIKTALKDIDAFNAAYVEVAAEVDRKSSIGSFGGD